MIIAPHSRLTPMMIVFCLGLAGKFGPVELLDILGKNVLK